jgi:hypothetical protein
MNQREAKRHVCAAVARIIAGHRFEGAGYLGTDCWDDRDEEPLTEDDLERLDQAAWELANELTRRS